MAEETLVIKTEAQAWALAQRVQAGESFDEVKELIFDGWPKFELSVKGRDWDSSVPTRVMSPLLDMQKDINRAYAEVRYGDPNLHRLKEDEREDLELVVKVEKGSSIFSASFWNQFTEMAKIAFERMDGTQAVYTVTMLALVIGGTISYRSWLSHRTKTKGMDKDVSMSQQETKRLEILATALASNNALVAAQQATIETQNRLLKAVKPEDKVTFKGITLTGAQAEQIAQPERAASEDKHITGTFRVLGNRTDRGVNFRVTFQREDGLVITADVPNDLPADQKNLIRDAEWGKSKLALAINASELRGNLHSAVVISAAKA
jgi:hypothetical protein